MEAPICQIALSISDLVKSRHWYQALGLDWAGGMGPLSGEHPAKMLDLPEVEVQIEWMRGQDSMSQLELIHFVRPRPLPMPEDRNLHYAGYGAVSLIVSDFEATLSGLNRERREVQITGAQGSRSLWLKDPDGITVEIMERDPLRLRKSSGDDHSLASIRAITITVADLDKAKRFWVSAVGIGECSPGACELNPFPKDVDGGVVDWDQVLLKGGSVIVRLLKPRRPAIVPIVSGRRLSDTGVLNVAVIVDEKSAFDHLCRRVSQMGYRFSTEDPMLMGEEAGARYGYDDQGNSIEFGFVRPGHESRYGWKR
jgi:catechol 2,3-dioxygenase-like lactoylglutathione lyase family enzyme